MPTADKTEHDFLENPRSAERVTLKEFLLGIMNERERKSDIKTIELQERIRHIEMVYARKDDMQTIMAMQKEAIGKAEVANEKRFEGVNEFRAQLSDQQRTYVSEEKVEVQFKAVNEKIDSVLARVLETKGRDSGIGMMWGIIMGVSILVVGIIALLLRK